MTDPGPTELPGFMTEDLHPRFSDDVATYASQTSRDVSYVEVRLDGATMGYVWADDGDAAAYRGAADAGADGANLGSVFTPLLRAARARGESPRAALAGFAADGEIDGLTVGPVRGPLPFPEFAALAGPPFGVRGGTAGDARDRR